MTTLLHFSNEVVELITVYSNLLIITVYRQPNDEKGGHPSKREEFKEAFQQLQNVLNRFVGKLSNIINVW